MYNEYKNGASVASVLSHEYNLSNSKIYKLFKEYGLQIKDNRTKSLKYTCNEHYFDVIDTEDKAYWLGFIFADGYITSDMKCFGMSLQYDDTYILQALKDDLQATYPIHTYNVSSGYNLTSVYSRLRISNPYIVDVLCYHGVVPHKSNILKPPSNLQSNLIRHFIRGYFDGNGCITISTKGKYASIEIISTPDMLDYIMQNLLEADCIDRLYPYSKRKQHHIVMRTKFGKRQSIENTFHYFYDNCNHKLLRKYNKFLKYFSYYNI